MARFKVCPKCKGEDIERNLVGWFCYDCDWEEPLTEEEKDNLEEYSGEEDR